MEEKQNMITCDNKALSLLQELVDCGMLTSDSVHDIIMASILNFADEEIKDENKN